VDNREVRGRLLLNPFKILLHILLVIRKARFLLPPFLLRTTQFLQFGLDFIGLLQEVCN
jgi:hypothetical protein